MEEDTEYKKLPVEERLVHKLWKARQHGYEEVTKIFRQQDDDKSQEFSKYLGLVKKFVVDSNAVAQEKGLEAVLAYVECYALAGKSAGEVISGIVGKCIAAPKTRTKELAVQITLMYIEAEKADIVLEELIKGMEHKNPKISAACVACTTQALREFGSKVVTIKPLVKKISTLLEDRDKTVRDEGKAMVIEMYRWVGLALKPQLNNLKPVQVSELEAEFEKVKPGQAQPTRYLRSQQQKQAKLAEEAVTAEGEAGKETEEVAPPDVDPMELIDPVDILSLLPKDLYEKLEAKKWQERKEAVDAIEKLVQAPKLEAGDYGDLVRALKKIIAKDSNVVVIGVAGKCLCGLAVGLKKKFSPYASACIPTVLEKFKEKKMNVVTAMRDAIDAIYCSTTIEAIQEDVNVALESKNPQVKLETASFLARCFTKCTPNNLNKKVLKGYVTVLMKMLNDPDPLVRDNAAEALGTAMKVVGEKSMAPLINDLEAAKQNKIRECSDKAVVLKVRPATAPAKLMATTSSEPKPVARPNTATITVKRAVVKKPAAVQPINSATTTRGKVVKPAERELTQEEVDEKAVELLTETVLNEMSDSNYKTRLGAVEQFLQVLRGMDASEMNAQVLLRILNKKPGFRDTNIQVIKARLEAAKIIVETAKVSSTSLSSVLTDVASNLSDVKNGAMAAQVLSSFAEATSLDTVAPPVMELVWNQKSPKLQAEALLWLASACNEFGMCLEMSAVSDWVKKAMAVTNPTVKSAALSLVGSLVPHVGHSMANWFSGEKPAIQQQIQAEIDKREGDVAPEATRVQASQPTVNLGRQREGPRADISELISDELISQLRDKNWKVRIEALQKVETMVNGKKITSNLGELPGVLSQRLVDSNSKIAAAAMAICQALAASMGRQGNIHLRSLFPTIVLGMGDSKPMIRKAAAACLNSWGEHCGWEEFFAGEMLADAFKTGSPQMRTDLWTWLLAVFETLAEREDAKPLPKDELKAMLPHLYAHLEDRTPEVRKLAAEAVLPIMTHLSYKIMLDAADKLKPGSKMTVATHLDNARGSLPARENSKENLREVPNRMVAAGDAKTRPKTSTIQKKAVSAVKPTGRNKKEEETESGPMLQVNNLKHQRQIDEAKLKTLRWNFTAPRPEFIEQLRDQLTVANANKTLIFNMFHADFKYHLKSIEMLNDDWQKGREATVANLDLILKWMTLRFFDTNPSVLLKGLEYLQMVLSELALDGYKLSEYEASSFIPYLLIKIGDPKDAVRSGVKSLFDHLALIYPPSKLFFLIMDGLKSKNARQRTECLDLLAIFIGMFILNNYTPALKEIARHIADRDNSVRNAALNCIVQAWYKEGERTYKLIGQLSDKEMSLLEERIKRADKVKRVMPSAQPKPQKQPQPAVSEPLDDPYCDEAEEEEEEARTCYPATVTYTRTAVVKPSVSGPFGLDFELLERIEGVALDLHAPQLAEFDLNDILNDEPHFIPKLMSSESRAFPSTLTPPKPLQRINACTNESQTIDLVLSGISSIDFGTANLAMAQLDTLMQSDMATLLVSKADQFVMAVVMQLRLLHQASSVTSQPEQLAKTYRTLMMLLITFYKNAGLAERVSRGAIRDLMEQFLHLLVEERLQELDNGQSFVRVTNMLMVKVIERSDRTAVICALIKILHECVGNGNTSPRFLELAMKCLWKVVKNLPNWDQQLEYNVILLEIHLFCKAYPNVMWKKRGTGNDMPLRTIRTILHTMVKMKGSSILHELDLVDNSKDTELAAYLNKLIKAAKQEPTTSQHLTKSTHEQLAEVFRKIGSKDQTQEGLSNLYDFRASHPEADIEPFLLKSSQFFQQYIADGMQAIERDRAAVHEDVEKEGCRSPSYYMSRLKNLQAMAGLNSDVNVMGLAAQQQDDNMNQNNQLNEDKQELSSILRSPNSPPVANLEMLKQRLDRVKSAALRDEMS